MKKNFSLFIFLISFIFCMGCESNHTGEGTNGEGSTTEADVLFSPKVDCKDQPCL